jgi:hypothetical protein
MQMLFDYFHTFKAKTTVYYNKQYLILYSINLQDSWNVFTNEYVVQSQLEIFSLPILVYGTADNDNYHLGFSVYNPATNW